MNWLLEALLSFIAAASFGIVFNAPQKTLVSCGLVGMSGWLIYRAYFLAFDDSVQASFAGAFAVALAAHILAKKFKMPMIIFSIAGIIPLVPGSKAYNAMRNIVENNYLEAIAFASEALMVSGAIAMGLVFAEVLMQLFFKQQAKRMQKKSA
ncbi:threonine/serine exporter family protein [Planomicrobium sp. CPCC 101079]|uniref:threonine/serine exporter family protein n=1 Tax=Planomicrobium sp. CPCC 101079 TaxID=2599618 RepID=UPI0011B7B284|nr:threonine/serine exporter family protein [Planomicrobium sp. CPCC 101079]TWT03429.1 threonine/serine exporter [Planomicrobium sp. CPCC 101079]